MWLLLGDSQDLSLLWLYQGLQQRNVAPIQVITGEMLAYCKQYDYQLNNQETQLSLTFHDGKRIELKDIRGVVNRLSSIPTAHLSNAIEEDRQYATQEIYAFFVSWLTSLPQPMINPPTSSGLCGAWRQPGEWRWMAVQSGLPIFPYHRSSTNTIEPPARHLSETVTVLVLDKNVFGFPLPVEIQEGCVRLASRVQSRLLGVTFILIEQSWYMIEATPLPNLVLGGAAFLDCLTYALKE